jgi:hypothetical protein
MRAGLPRPTFAQVTATLALFVALGGTGYAATTIGTSQIADNAVTTPKLAAGAVTASHLAPATLAALQGKTGPQGPAGPPGAAGPSDTYAAFRASGTVTPGSFVTFFQLPAGSWLFQANVVLTNTAGSAREVTCTVGAGGVTIDTATTDLEAAGAQDTQTVTLAGTAGPIGASIPAFGCSTSGTPGDVQFVDGDLIATQVGTLHQVVPRP